MDVEIKGRVHHKLPLIVVDSPGPPLLGWDWIRVVNIEWKDINHMELKQEQKAEKEERLKRLKEQYSSVFEDCLHACKASQTTQTASLILNTIATSN